MKITPVMRRGMILALLAVLALLTARRWGAIREVGKETLARDTTWSGDVIVTGDVHVPEGVTLTIAPGTKVRFRKLDEGSDRNLFGIESPYYPQAEIVVTGRLLAKGTADRPILFTSAEGKPQPGDWGTLNFLGSRGNVVEHCRFEFAYNGIHAHGGQVTIADSSFRRCAVAISVKKEEEAKGTPGFGIPSDITVTGNLIEENKGGVNVRLSRAVITGNTIRDNKFFGIWLKEQCQGEISRNTITGNQKGIYFYRAGGVIITANNIYDNLDYNLAIADDQPTDIMAAGNWFGTVERARIEALLFDQRTDPAIGRIIVEPFLSAPVRAAGR
jgi:parallel beta-helix repeat protein